VGGRANELGDPSPWRVCSWDSTAEDIAKYYYHRCTVRAPDTEAGGCNFRDEFTCTEGNYLGEEEPSEGMRFGLVPPELYETERTPEPVPTGVESTGPVEPNLLWCALTLMVARRVEDWSVLLCLLAMNERARLNREILNGSRIRLRFRSIVASECNDSLTPNPAKYFCPGPLFSQSNLFRNPLCSWLPMGENSICSWKGVVLEKWNWNGQRTCS